MTDSNLYLERENCAKFVNKMGITSKEIACAGSITNVNKAMAADGKPIPRKPLTIPDKKKINIMKIRMLTSLEGNKLFKISPFISKNRPVLNYR